MKPSEAVHALRDYHERTRSRKPCQLCMLPQATLDIIAELFADKAKNPDAFTWIAMARWLKEQKLCSSSEATLRNHATGLCETWNAKQKTPKRR